MLNLHSKIYNLQSKIPTFAPQTALSSSRFIGREESPDTTEKHSG